MLLQAVVIIFFMLAIPLDRASATENVDCTLEPTQGNKHVSLSNGVVATMRWSSCTHLVVDITFDPISRSLLHAPNLALDKAASLIDEFEKKTKKNVCPFGGNISVAFRSRRNEKKSYNFGEDIPVSNTNVSGWDGASVLVRREKKSTKLFVRYWANP